MTIIKASDVQEGDLIRVTTVDVDRTNSFQGIADHTKPSTSGRVTYRWFTADDWTLWTSAEGAVIELLDRPKPKLTVPTLPNAVVKYKFDAWRPEDRFAVRDEAGKWVCYDAEGGQRNKRSSDEDLQAMLLEDDPNFEVLFAGVAK